MRSEGNGWVGLREEKEQEVGTERGRWGKRRTNKETRDNIDMDEGIGKKSGHKERSQ